MCFLRKLPKEKTAGGNIEEKSQKKKKTQVADDVLSDDNMEVCVCV